MLRLDQFWKFLGLVLLSSCSTPSVTISSNKEAEVSSLTMDAGGVQSRKLLGKTPLILKDNEFKNLTVEIKSADSKPFILYIPGLDGQQNELNVKLEELPPAVEKDAALNVKKDNELSKKQQVDRVMRLLIKGFQALYENNSNLALSLGAEASVIDPQLSSPHILKGLAELQAEKGEAAKLSFEKAKILDPENSDIDNFMKGIP